MFVDKWPHHSWPWPNPKANPISDYIQSLGRGIRDGVSREDVEEMIRDAIEEDRRSRDPEYDRKVRLDKLKEAAQELGLDVEIVVKPKAS